MTRARDFSQNLGNVSGGGGGTTNVTLAALQPFLTTSNVVQRGANLYFSNALSFANLQLASINDLKDVVITNKSNNQALLWNGFEWAPGNIIVTANLALNTTNDLREGSNNLYFTNSRARTAFTAANPTIIIDWAAGTIAANLAAVSNSANTTDGLPEGFTNKYYSNARVKTFLNEVANLQDLRDVIYPGNDPALIPIGRTLVWDTANGGYWAPGNYSPEVSNFANAAEQANIVLSISNFTTANLTEFGNLYFTNQRVFANVANIHLDTLKDVWIQQNVLIQGSVLAYDGNGNWIPQSAGSLGNVGSASTAQFATRAELANLALFANVAFHALTANIANVALRAVFAETANTVLQSIQLAAQVTSIANFTTDNLREGNTNLYFTNQRVLSNVLQMRLDTFADVSTSTANVGQVLQYNGTNWVPGDAISSALSSAFAERANVANLVLTISNFTTDNLQEGANSLYYSTTKLSNDIQSAIFAKDITLDDLVVGGDLTVQGNVALFNVSNLRTESRVITLASSAGSPSQAEGSGIYVNGANASLVYSQTNDGFGFNKNLTINGNLIPAISGVYSLGTQTKLWKDLFIGAQTIYMGNTRISENLSGGLSVKDQFGNDAAIQLSNVSATESVTVNRVYSNVAPLTEFNSYIGGNVKQFVNGTTGNLYLGIMKGGTLTKFAGLRVVETKDGSANVRSDLRFYTDNEATDNSTARLSILGTGNIELNSNLVTINNIRILDNFGNFTGNSFLGTTDVEITHGGTGANTRPNARRNLFSDFGNGIVAKIGGATNTLAAISIVQGTGVTVTDGDGQNGNPTIAIGQPVAITDSVQFRNLTLSGNLLVLGNVTAVYSNTLVINDPMIQLGYGNPADAYDLGFIGHYNTGTLERHAGFFRDHTDGLFKVFDNLTSQPGLNDIDTSNVTFRLANVAATTFIGNVIGTVSTLNNHTTDALREGTGNLYYTAARVNATVRPMFTTANVIETSGNLYFTNARVIAALSDLTTANIREVSSNLYFTNTRVLDALATSNVLVNNLTANNLLANSLTITGNVTFGSGAGGSITGLNDVTSSNVTTSRLVVSNTAIINNLTVAGDLTVQGNVVTLNTATLTVEDKNITLANGAVNAAAADGAGITIAGANANLTYVSASDRFEFTKSINVLGNISLTGSFVSENFSANNITANTLSVSGNVSFGTGVGGTLAGLAYAYATNVITNVLIANTIAPTRVTGNLVVDGKIFANNLVLQNIDVTDVILYGNITAGGGSLFNTLQANTITTGSLSVTSNIITLLSGVTGSSTSNASISVNRGANADVALRWEEEIDRWQFTNDGSLYYNLPIPSEYDNVIYSLSAETSNVTYAANLKLTGTKSSGNVLIQDQIAFKGTGLVRVSRQDADTIIVDAGVAPVVVTPVSAATPVEITRFRTNLYRTAEYIYTLNVSGYTDNNHANLYNAGKILILHDNSEVMFSQYAMLLSGTGQELATFTTNINTGNVILYAQATSALANVQITVRLSGTTYTEV